MIHIETDIMEHAKIDILKGHYPRFLDRQNVPGVSLSTAYNGVAQKTRAKLYVPLRDYPKEEEFILCTGKLTLFHDYAPFVNNYEIYQIREEPYPVQVAPPVVMQPKSKVKRKDSLSRTDSGMSGDPEEVEELTCDVIKKHWCYYVLCLGLCFD